MDTPSTDVASTEAQPAQDVDGFLGKYVELTEAEGEAKAPPKEKKKVADPVEADADELPDEEEEETLEEGEDDSPDDEEEAQDEDDSDDDEATDEEDEEQPELIPVKIDGKVERVTLDELKKGYSRTKVFTQKTQDVAEQRKALTATEQQIAAERAQLAQAIEAVSAQLEAADPEPDWDTLASVDREEFLFQKQVWADKKERKAKLQAVKAEMERRNAEQSQKQFAETIKAEGDALLEKIPAWKDPKKAESEQKEIRDYVIGLGFTPEDIDKVYDHRLVLALRDAARYKRLMRKKVEVPDDEPGRSTKIKESPKPLKPGRSGRVKRGVRQKREAAMEQLKKTGKASDAQSVFALIPGLFD